MSAIAKALRSAPAAKAGRVSTAAQDADLTVGPECRWFQVGQAAPVDLTRRRAIRLILIRLVETQQSAPGKANSLDDLIEAGWPGEAMYGDSGASRAYVALSKLRKMGLRELLVTQDDGYLFAAKTRIATVGTDS